MAVPNLTMEVVSDITLTQRRSYALADETLIRPDNAVNLYGGEWLTFDASNRLIRASNVAVVGNAATKRSFLLWMEKGSLDAQMIGKTPILFMADWEAKTLLFDAAAVVGGGAAITTVLQGLKVATIVKYGRNFSGLVGHGGAADTDPVVAAVTKIAGTDGYMHIMRASRA